MCMLLRVVSTTSPCMRVSHTLHKLESWIFPFCFKLLLLYIRTSSSLTFDDKVGVLSQ
jgi:hypothetical protein